MDTPADLPQDVEDELIAILEGPETECDARVESLMARHAEHAEAIRSLLDESDDADLIPGYRILQPIGEGGMGCVFVAKQEGRLRRRVAIKIIRPDLGIDAEQAVARFGLERQALALMEHSNIARVFDAGTTRDGRPYFVMEYVRGVPITEYCDVNRLSLAERLALFQQLCAGVQHAHHKGVIHRDLKPGNVLVSSADGAPVVKVIDFGLARATEAWSAQQSFFTEHGAMLGTLGYVSPEQAGQGAGDVDARTDVYALGVILYELLTGQLPFDPRAIREGGFLEMLRLLREEEPSRPSTRIEESGGALAKQRQISLRGLRTALSGDLDWVVMRALEKDRNRRYPTPVALAEDVQRFRDNEPVTAGPPTLSYRLSRLARRHRGAAVVAVAVLVSLTLGLLGFLRGYLNEREARRMGEVAVQTAAAALAPLDEAAARAEFRALLPAWPERLEALEAWRERHVALPGKVEEFEALLAGWDGDAAVAERLEPLVEPLRRASGRLGDLLEESAAAVEWARTVGTRSIDAHRGVWAEAAADIAADARFGDVELTPQVGLVPLGPDPDSKLWEFAHLRSARPGQETPSRDERNRVQLQEGNGIVFVLVPGGMVWQSGAEDGDEQEAELEPFFIAKHELTQAQWLRLGGAENRSVHQPPLSQLGVPVSLLHPLENVAQAEADDVLARNGLSLPTELQWMHACRAEPGSRREFHVGAEALVSGGDPVANVYDASTKRIRSPEKARAAFDDRHIIHAAVGKFAANPWGLHDMHGNVEEWVRDDYSYSLLPARPGDGLRALPEGQAATAQRLAKGGSYWSTPEQASAANRAFNDGVQMPTAGLRAARRVYR